MKIMAKKCPNCNSKNVAFVSWINPSPTEKGPIIFRCRNCGNNFNVSSF